MESPSSEIGSLHLELGLDHNSFFTDPLDDLSMLIATSTPSTCLQHKSNIDVGSSSHLKWSAQKREACEIDSAETPFDYGRASSEHAKMNSWNISFGHPHSYAESTPSTSVRTRKHFSVQKSKEEAHADEIILAYLENELDQIVESNQTMIHQGDIKNLGNKEHSTHSTRNCLDSSLSQVLKGEPFPSNCKFGEVAYTPKNGAHIMAERRRREKLNQKFIALSAIVPGLKKADKASILADAINYVKRLEEQLRVLEDQVPKAVNSCASKYSDEASYNHLQRQGCKKVKLEGLLQSDIEARVVGKNVLIRVHCGKTESVLMKALEELENLHLSVVNANVLSFSNKAIDLTFTAQVEGDCKMTAEDIVKALHVFFKGLN